MQFGVREICDVVFKAKNAGTMGTMPYVAGQPVLYIDTAKTSNMEGAATTVYAQGGKGNSRLIAWEGEKTLTFTVEDALLSELGFAILSGAGLLNADTDNTVYVHQTSMAIQGTDGSIDLSEVLGDDILSEKSPVFVMAMEHGSIKEFVSGLTYNSENKKFTGDVITKERTVFVDYYVAKNAGVTEMTIDMENFAGYYYVEASTLFRRQSDGKDLPAELIFPNVKIQSNFTFAMASTGDPSTFTFTMDAMPGYTRFDRTKKVLCVMQVVDEAAAVTTTDKDSINNDANGEFNYPLEVANPEETDDPAESTD